MTDSICCSKRDLHTSRERDNSPVAGLFIAVPMTLDFRIDIPAAEGADQTVQTFAAISFSDRERQWSITVAGETDEALGELGDLLGRRGGFLAGLRMFR